MTATHIWKMIKVRYRLSAKVQMGFAMGFPEFVIGKCGFHTQDTQEFKTLKLSLSRKGIVLSDTIPLSWFTSSVFIPWEKAVKFSLPDTTASTGDTMDSPPLTQLNPQPLDGQYSTLHLDDPREISIDLPWSDGFTDYVKENKLFGS
ncbi:MAG: hypothetical protein HUN04_22020 [Desulfobacter sp.]|nr:MAG: hypothetical protein HUN04_22020 [Desulfobacter sp.]